MKIILQKSDAIEDWYSIERAQHKNRQWLALCGPHSARLMDSARLSPEACIEGSAEEMRALAKAIKTRGSAGFKRCAVRVVGQAAYFCSPRNSEREAKVPLTDADEFADHVLAVLPD